MAVQIDSDLFFNGGRVTGLQNAIDLNEPATLNQLLNFVNNSSWKDNVRVASTANVNFAAPGTSIDGVTLVIGDRILLKNQTSGFQNTIVVFNGGSNPLTFTTDSDTFDKLESAIVAVDEGTSNAGTRWRQTQVNGIFGTAPLVWVQDGQAVPDASETTKGSVEIATQAETDAGTLDNVVITPLKLKNSPYAKLSISGDFGDGTATSYTITHNFNTRDVSVIISQKSAPFNDVVMEVQKSLNSVTVITAIPVALNSRRITVSKL
jgi:hypothetical protein